MRDREVCNSPDKIYLQLDPDSIHDSTWCVDKINDDDIEYSKSPAQGKQPSYVPVEEIENILYDKLIISYCDGDVEGIDGIRECAQEIHNLITKPKEA